MASIASCRRVTFLNHLPFLKYVSYSQHSSSSSRSIIPCHHVVDVVLIPENVIASQSDDDDDRPNFPILRRPISFLVRFVIYFIFGLESCCRHRRRPSG